MNKRFALGVLAYLLPTFALGYVWHLVLFKDYYESLSIYRPDVTRCSARFFPGASPRLRSEPST